MDNLSKMSEQELQSYIADAAKVLESKQNEKRKDVLVQIHNLAQSIGVSVEITDKKSRISRRGGKVAPKFQNPQNPSDKWSGRGMKPNWMKALLEQGFNQEDLRI